MKKILTLLVMFLATASILTAQTPKLNYQMIVRNQKATDVTIGGKVFHENDLVYSTTVTGTLKVLTNSSAVYEQNFAEATNMNGMLTIILDNTNTQNTRLEKIDWANSKLCVIISDLGINDTTEILPVPYAFNVFTDSSITTARIVAYIEKETTGALAADSIFDAAESNEDFMEEATLRVANILKQNPGMVKELAIYFLHKVTAEDVQMAYDTLDDNIDYIVNKIANYTKQHKTTVYDVVKYYLGNATVNDAKALWSAAMNNQYSDTIIYMIVDSVNHYIAQHKQWIKNTAKYVVTHVDIDDVAGMHTLFKTSNNATYEYMKSVLDSLINDYLVKNHYATAKCGDQVITLCDLKEQIDQLREYGFKTCPAFGNNNKTQYPSVSTPITLSEDVTELSHNTADYWYELTFPGTNYPSETVAINNLNLTNNTISASLENYANRTVVFRPAMKQKCMDVVTYGKYDTAQCTSTVCQLPEIASLDITGTSVAELASNHGVALTAKLTNTYYNNMQYGFRYSVNDGQTWTNMTTTVTSTDGLTFSDTIKMNLCGKNIKVQAYVTVDNYTDSEDTTFKLRDIWLDFDPAAVDNTYTSPVTLTAQNHIAISTQAYINALGTNKPSVEQIVAKYGAEFGVNVVPTYTWTGTNTNFTSNNKTVQLNAPDTYNVTCSFSIFNSAPCVLTGTVKVVQQ